MGFGMKFTIDPGSAADLGKILTVAESLKADLPEGHTGPNLIKTLARRVMEQAKTVPIEGDGQRD